MHVIQVKHYNSWIQQLGRPTNHITVMSHVTPLTLCHTDKHTFFFPPIYLLFLKQILWFVSFISSSPNYPSLQPPPSLLCPLVVVRFDRDLCGRVIFGLVWCVRWMEGWGTSGEKIGRKRRASMAGTTFGARPAPRITLWWWFMASSGGCSSLLISGWIVLFVAGSWAAVLFGLGLDLIYLRKILVSFNLHFFLRV